MSIHLSTLAHQVDETHAQCDACQWRCVLADGEWGRCAVRSGTGDGVDANNYALISAAAVGPIETHRLWHFFPDSLAVAIGSWGYAFPEDQTRSSYATIPADETKRRKLDPDRVATFALERLCRGVVWAYSDPAVSFDYLLDVLQLSRASSRYTAMVTSGFLTLDALDAIGHYLDGVSLELRAFGDASYQRLTGVAQWRGILDVAQQAKTRHRCHLEVTTRLHHGVNTDPDELRAMVGWIHDTLGADTPWHVLPGDAGAESAAAVTRARRVGMEAGLQFVYGPEANQSTRCPNCTNEVITRANGVTQLAAVNDGRCRRCGHDLNVRTSIFKK